MGASKRRQWFPQPADRKQSVLQVARLEQDDIKITVQTAVLKAVVQQVKFAGEFFFSQQTGLITIGAHNDGRSKLLRNQQRLVPELIRRAVGIDCCNFRRTAAIATGKHVKAYPSLTQQSSQRDDKRRLPASADGNIPN